MQEFGEVVIQCFVAIRLCLAPLFNEFVLISFCVEFNVHMSSSLPVGPVNFNFIPKISSYQAAEEAQKYFC